MTTNGAHTEGIASMQRQYTTAPPRNRNTRPITRRLDGSYDVGGVYTAWATCPPRPDTWNCSCPDFARRKAVGGGHCKHLVALAPIVADRVAGLAELAAACGVESPAPCPAPVRDAATVAARYAAAMRDLYGDLAA